ncbi:LLM class flavin-dependent oxidoreductase [Frankia nepalensis]|uniref:LLM class flavin-dependent oxidoreductase n=1 Tax=Frankia nepalensis TaxID=1836974 RepID=UPI001EE46518|nr:LLM class flavin-dependent oxidoreductase [Frankia nepalensis]
MRVGVVLPLTEYPWKQPSYLDIRDLALQAEGAGFDSVWVFDHLLFRSPGAPTEGAWESWTTLSALAEATNRVTLGTFVLCAAFRHPGVLAKMAVTLDEISRGRLVLGLGAGWHQPEFDAFGLPFDHRAERLAEQLEIITALLRTGHADHDGPFHRLRDAELRPAPRRRIPVLVGGGGPRLLRLAARYADLWNTCWYGAPPPDDPSDGPQPDDPRKVGAAAGQTGSATGELAGVRTMARAACAAEGRDPATLGVTVGVNVAPRAPGHPSPHPPPDYPVLAGTPEAVAAGLRRYEALGVDHLICNLNPHYPHAQRLLAAALSLYRTDPAHAPASTASPAPTPQQTCWIADVPDRRALGLPTSQIADLPDRLRRSGRNPVADPGGNPSPIREETRRRSGRDPVADPAGTLGSADPAGTPADGADHLGTAGTGRRPADVLDDRRDPRPAIPVRR